MRRPISTKAAESIIAGASFDNNLLCISEKEIFVVAKVADEFIAAMKRAGAVQLNSAQVEKLAQTVFDFEPGKGGGRGRARVKHEFVGKDPGGAGGRHRHDFARGNPLAVWRNG